MLHFLQVCRGPGWDVSMVALLNPMTLWWQQRCSENSRYVLSSGLPDVNLSSAAICPPVYLSEKFFVFETKCLLGVRCGGRFLSPAHRDEEVLFAGSLDEALPFKGLDIFRKKKSKNAPKVKLCLKLKGFMLKRLQRWCINLVVIIQEFSAVSSFHLSKQRRTRTIKEDVFCGWSQKCGGIRKRKRKEVTGCLLLRPRDMCLECGEVNEPSDLPAGFAQFAPFLLISCHQVNLPEVSRGRYIGQEEDGDGSAGRRRSSHPLGAWNDPVFVHDVFCPGYHHSALLRWKVCMPRCKFSNCCTAWENC